MTKVSRAITAAIIGIATGCEAFAPHSSRDLRSAAIRTDPSQKSQSTRNAFFGFGADEKTPKSKALIERTKDIIYNKSGFYSDYDAGVFSEEFVFRGPYIGPLNKEDYLATMDAFGISKAIPDISPNAWGYSIDPNDPNRVWFMVRNTGTFDGETFAPGVLNYKANGAKLEGCPETFSIIFDEEQNMKYFSVGYVADRFEGNVNGKGAAVGIMNAIGFPFPDPGPVLRFLQWFGTEVVGIPPLSYSKKNVPEWWTDEGKGAKGYRS